MEMHKEGLLQVYIACTSCILGPSYSQTRVCIYNITTIKEYTQEKARHNIYINEVFFDRTNKTNQFWKNY